MKNFIKSLFMGAIIIATSVTAMFIISIIPDTYNIFINANGFLAVCVFFTMIAELVVGIVIAFLIGEAYRKGGK
jgi:hypothetical protein